jgi:hypothetical protein
VRIINIMHANIHFTQRSYPSKITIFLKQGERNGWSNFRRSSVLVIKEFCPLTVGQILGGLVFVKIVHNPQNKFHRVATSSV